MPCGSIIIEGLRVFARHGVMEQENKGGNVFQLDIRLSYTCGDAMRTDSLDRAVNYAEVVGIARGEMSQPSMLLENCVYRIREAILQRYPAVTGGRITLRKLRPPIEGELSAVGFDYEWQAPLLKLKTQN